MDKRKLELSDFYKLKTIFTNNGWQSKFGQEYALKNFWELITNLNNEQKELILDLCSRYLWVSMPEYMGLLLETIKTIEEDKLANCQRIIVFPIINPSDAKKVKSSSSLIYLFKSAYFGWPNYENISFVVIDSYKDFSKERFKEGDLLFLVDDYVGSGETLNSTLSEIRKNTSLKNGIINVLALAAQLETLDGLNKSGISWYVKHKRNKGISDNYNSPILEMQIQLMKEIEKLIIEGNYFSFGYENSEALVTMHRTPDNTFPIFWKDHRKGGKIYKAPFPRIT